MAELHIEKPDGTKFTIERDGSITNAISGIQIDWCDKCEQWRSLQGGHYLQMEGLTMLWHCEACK
jgi:hypothetical protein